MCGIAGLIDPSGAAIDREALTRMTNALMPRGPDAQATLVRAGVGLGHTRLKIIDLSEAGAQPMSREDETPQALHRGPIDIVFNGEIYNFQDLRAELQGHGHVFRSRSDTEVLLAAYLQWGDQMLVRLEGMFAFAIWDERKKHLLAARDRMGKKPFYWARIPRGDGRPPLFAFASELKALVHAPGFQRKLDHVALSRYLAFEYVPPPRTIFAGARKLNASERLTLDLAADARAQPQIGRYWDLPFPEAHEKLKLDEAAEELWFLFRRAVERRLVSDVPLGVFLSGGIDSSAVATTMKALLGSGRNIKTFSIGFSDPTYDESGHARAVARYLGCEHREEILDPRVMLQVLPEVARFLDEPLADASIVPTYLLSRFTRETVTVALGGDGGDELFAGYPTFGVDRTASLFFDRTPAIVRRLIARAANLLPARTGYFSLDFKVHQFLRGGHLPGPRRHQRWLASFLPEEQEGLLRPEIWKDVSVDPLSIIEERIAATTARDKEDRLMDFYARFYLPGDVNVKVDRASGAVGLEVRAPFLDTDMVSFACRIPPRLRRQGQVSKRVLKRAMQGRLPDDILTRKKQGFGVPVARWMKEDLKQELMDQLAPDKIAREGLFQPDVVSALVDDHLRGRRDRRKALWTLLTFERWLEHYGSPPGGGTS